MIDQQAWYLGPAAATVTTGEDSITVVVRGVLTAPVFEALHLRLAAVRAKRQAVILDESVLVAVTCCSATEAALRGSPAYLAREVAIGVPMFRMPWARRHCRLMSAVGLPRRAFALAPALAC